MVLKIDDEKNGFPNEKIINMVYELCYANLTTLFKCLIEYFIWWKLIVLIQLYIEFRKCIDEIIRIDHNDPNWNGWKLILS